MQWNLYKADTIRSKKKFPLYGDIRFIEYFPKTIIFKNIRITRILMLLNDTRASTGR